VQSEKLKKYVLFVVSILAAFLIIWQNENKDIAAYESSTGKDEPDFFIVNGKYTLFNEKGNISSVIKSEKAKHYPDRNIAVLTEPNLLVYREDNTPWRVTAESGEYSLDQEKIELEKNVVIIRDEHLATPWKLTTESLTILNKSRFATTTQAVTISDSVSIMKGIGMNAWLDDKRIKLTSNVRGSYVQHN
jgi:lipopolysaccharide export system protein LptC